MLFLTMQIGRRLGLALAVGLEVDFSVVWVVSLSLFSLGLPLPAKAVPTGGNRVVSLLLSGEWLRLSCGHLSAFSVHLPQQLAISEVGFLGWTVSGVRGGRLGKSAVPSGMDTFSLLLGASPTNRGGGSLCL